MTVVRSEDRGRTAESVAAAFFARLGRPPTDAERSFIAQIAADWGPDDLPEWTSEDLAVEAAEFWRRASAITGAEVWFRPARRDGIELLEIVQDDAPFIVSSVMGEVTAQGDHVLAMCHPIVEAGGRRRSLMQIALAAAPNRLALVSGLEGTLSDLRAAVQDFDAMTGLLKAAIDALEAAAKADAESLAFLRWLNSGRFVFLGARRYVMQGDDLNPVEGWGVLRDPGRHILRQSGEEPASWTALRERPAVTVAKSNLRSRVHRRVHMDYVGVEQFDAEGDPVGEIRFVGLFTAEAYDLPVDQTPLIRAKTAEVFERAHVPPGGHSAARLRNILNGWPRDDLFQIGQEELLEGALQALRLQDRPRVDLFVRVDPFERFASILVYVPRERFDYDFVTAASQLLAARFGGQVTAVYPEFNDAALARLQVVLLFEHRKRLQPDLAEVRADLAELARTWHDRFAQAAMDLLEGADRDAALAWAATAPIDYQAANTPADALADLEMVEGLHRDSQVTVRMFRRPGDGKERARFKLYARRTGPALADVAPILEHMGLKALREDAFAFRSEGRRVQIDEYLVEDRGGEALDLKVIADDFERAFCAVWAGQAESDGFNRLVLALGVSWREAALVRALAKYRQQSGLDPTQTVQEQSLADHPQIARLILDLFAARFDPDRDGDLAAREAESEAIWGQIQAALQAVDALDADRALRRIALLVRACVRTNFYQRDAEGRPKTAISFKVASRELSDLPAPKPFREIFVSAPHVDGVHLRFGPIARGGLRWSDRRDDFRTEVLGLVKAQQVKNAVIVPVGSKGGFFPKRLPKGGAPDAVREAAVEAYKTFLRGLLDLTDNLGADGEVIRPDRVVVYDGDDPYLVVAADKGTASFSDIANGVAEDYGFWLGDAFASGGSAGYDHKEMGITARGAWEAVKRHFREMGKDIQAEPFTVIGVGDMSGDVFGNGMLLSEQTRLLAAFDHRHVFIDPDPDPATSFAERERLFKLPRSSWDDYDKSLISEGGGVFPRSAKSVTLSPQMKALLETEAEALTPAELIHAVLKAPAELLYLGGIGTYVKASGESQADAGDKVNDAIRINADELRCQVVGEGANLGFTQAGRIQFALAGGRINTDAIDNSAGVDSSDHEVNIKILTGAVERAGALPRQDRDKLLKSMTEDVAAKVLAHNYDQTLALSLMQAEAPADLEAHARFMADLEAEGRLDRAVEGLPDAKTIAQRGAARIGLTRPELAVLLAYGKLSLFEDIEASKAPDDPFFLSTLHAYFPEPLSAFPEAMERHRLRREIIATVLDNEIVNRCGPTFAPRLRQAAGGDTTALVVAFEAARAILDFEETWRAVEALDGKVPAAGQIALFRELAYVLRGQTFWLARRLAKHPAGVQDLIDRYRPAVHDLRGLGLQVLSPIEQAQADERVRRFTEAGAPESLARTVAEMRPLTTVDDLVNLAMDSKMSVTAAARVYHAAGGAFGFDQVRAGAGTLIGGDAYERTAVRRLLEDLLAQQTAVAQAVFAQAKGQPLETDAAVADAIQAYAAAHRIEADKAAAAISEIAQSDGGWSFAKLTIANAALRDLA